MLALQHPPPLTETTKTATVQNQPCLIRTIRVEEGEQKCGSVEGQRSGRVEELYRGDLTTSRSSSTRQRAVQWLLTSASSGWTLRRWRMSHLLPTIVTTVLGSAWSRSSFSQRSQCSNVTTQHYTQSLSSITSRATAEQAMYS